MQGGWGENRQQSAVCSTPRNPALPLPALHRAAVPHPPADGPNHHRCAHHLLRPDGKHVSPRAARPTASRAGGGGRTGAGVEKKPWTGRCTATLSRRLWVSVQRPGSVPCRPPTSPRGGRWPSALDPAVGALEPAGISAAICARGESLKVKAGDPLGMSCRM